MGVLRQIPTAAAFLSPIMFALILSLLPEGQGKVVRVTSFMDRGAMISKNCRKQVWFGVVRDLSPVDTQQLCGLLRVEASQPVRLPVLMSLGNSSFSITVELDASKLWVRVGEERFRIDQTLEAEHWTRLCLGVRPSLVPTTPAVPASTTPADPASNAPADPASTRPADLASSMIADPASTTPDDPASTTPADPVSTTPVDPASTTPTDPASTTSADPASTTPADLTSTTPADPASTTSTSPVSTTLPDPASTTPVDSASTTPVDPASTTPVHPASTTPSAPASTTPVDPASTTPADFTSAMPADPASTTPANPASTTPADPASTTPADPASTTPSQPASQTLYKVWMTVGEHFVEVTNSDDPRLAVLEAWECVFGNNGSSFVGLLAGISTQSSIPDWPLTNVSCSEALARGEVPYMTAWSTHGNVSPYSRMEEQQICSDQVHEITLYAAHGHKGFRKMCRSLGGHFASVKEAVPVEVDSNSCVTEEGFVSWLRDGGLQEERVSVHCPALHVNGTVGQLLCVQDLPCSRCRVQSSIRYFLYGPVEDFDREYSLRILPNETFYFEGKSISNITRRSGEWTLWSRLHHRWWRLGQDAWPLGRRLWYSTNLNTTLTFTSCNNLHFPADDGTCLLRSQRCDGHRDHPDGSDELGCRNRLISKTNDYDKNISPFKQFQNENIMEYFQLKNVDQISAAQGVATIQLFGYVVWRDHRLRLVDSKIGKNVFSCEDIWTPELHLYSGDTGPQANVSHVIKHCFVFSNSFLQEVNVTDPLVGWVSLEDFTVHVFMDIEMQVSSACRPKLSRYPFGRYTCNTSMAMSVHDDMKWDIHVGGYREIYDSQDRDLLDYHLDKATLTSHGDGLTFTLHLSGQAAYHILASFSPSGLMFFICYSTLHYPIGNFNERLMASLTSLLVLVALFSQTTITNVRTPYFKLLDVWYVVLIALSFLVVVSNSVVNALQRNRKGEHTVAADDNDDDNDEGIGRKQSVTKRAVWFNVMCRCFLLCAFILLVMVYVLIAKEYL